MPRTLPLVALAVTLACGDGDADVSTGTTTSDSQTATDPASTSTTPTTGDATTAPDPTSTSDASTTGPACPEPPGDAIVSTDLGPIAGHTDGDGLAFLGVRYAAAPVGDLRLRPPAPPAPLSCPTAADAYGPVCPQLVKNSEGEVTEVLGDEDCLTLNVWTPAADGAARPVLVFVHGGGNAVGSGSDELYRGTLLAQARDVVVVTFNYRLGALGWLTHPGLAAESQGGVSGNYALLDQIAALRWVQTNIAGFGGDPQRVLLFGESAGAVNTCALLHAPAAAGLYHAAVVQSGTCRERPLAAYSDAMSTPFVASSKCDGAPDVPACLRQIPADAFVQLAPDGYPDVAALAQGWGPHVDGVVLPSDGLSDMSSGTHNKVPIVIGNNAAETAAAVPPLTEAQVEAIVQATFGPLADEVLARYPFADYPDATTAYVALTSDVKFVCNARRSARAADAGQDLPVFRYVFAYDGYTTFGTAKAAASHGLELVYLFGNFDAVLAGDVEYTPNADDLAMRDQIQAMWTALAATGDPSTAALAWPLYGPADPYAGLDVPPAAGAGVRSEQCDFWDVVLGG